MREKAFTEQNFHTTLHAFYPKGYYAAYTSTYYSCCEAEQKSLERKLWNIFVMVKKKRFWTNTKFSRTPMCIQGSTTKGVGLLFQLKDEPRIYQTSFFRMDQVPVPFQRFSFDK